ncbi:MAG: transporter substrate-binding domain-containing protein, partial [Bacteroidales bacterium]|nr:transporter substrate-binding domain-containing protein [Bacteroidales bacterium]
MRVLYNNIIIIIFSSAIFFSCNKKQQEAEEIITIKEKPKNLILNKILKEKKLIATTDYNSTNYFVYRGEPMGYQFELLKSFTDYLGVKLEIKIINDLNSSFKCLNEKGCDMIALGLTVTKERSKEVDFSDPLSQTRQILVQRKPENWRKMRTMDEINSYLIRNPLDLAGKTIHIQKNTIFLSRLENLSDEIGADIIITEHPEATVEELITMVAKAEID